MPTTLTPSHAVNYWPESKCAKAFWSQQEARPYQELLRDTAAWLDPRPGERWLDLGCGCGPLTRALWVKSAGTLREVVGLDCAAVNEKSYQQIRDTVEPTPAPGRIRFVAADLSAGLSDWPDAGVDGVVSGLAVQYAESFDDVSGSWTPDAYDRLLREVHRVLRPGGRFVFSVNVPEPAWWKVALRSLPAVWQTRRPLRLLKNSWRMLRYGRWLKAEARRGRFHYLHDSAVRAKLAAAGFSGAECRLSYAGQAYLFRCRKPA